MADPVELTKCNRTKISTHTLGGGTLTHPLTQFRPKCQQGTPGFLTGLCPLLISRGQKRLGLISSHIKMKNSNVKISWHWWVLFFLGPVHVCNVYQDTPNVCYLSHNYIASAPLCVTQVFLFLLHFSLKSNLFFGAHLDGQCGEYTVLNCLTTVLCKEFWISKCCNTYQHNVLNRLFSFHYFTIFQMNLNIPNLEGIYTNHGQYYTEFWEHCHLLDFLDLPYFW